MRTLIFANILLLAAVIEAHGQGQPVILRCSLNGGLELHASRNPASDSLGRVQCGAVLLLIDQRFGSPHVRTEDGRDGYVIGQNLGQWSLEAEQQPPDASKPVVPVIALTPPSANVAADVRPTAPTPTQADKGCIAVALAGSHGVRNIVLLGVAGALISKQQYKVVAIRNYPAKVGDKFHGSDLQTIQNGGTKIVILGKKPSSDEIRSSCSNK